MVVWESLNVGMRSTRNSEVVKTEEGRKESLRARDSDETVQPAQQVLMRLLIAKRVVVSEG